MSAHSGNSVHKTFAVTIAFAVGALLLTLILYSVAQLAGVYSGLPSSAAKWSEAGAKILVLAGFAGLLVDTSRLLARLLWRKKIPYRLKLHKVLKENLA